MSSAASSRTDAELRGMRVMALHELAMAEAPADAVEDAMDAEDPKSALVALLLRERAQEKSAHHAGSGAAERLAASLGADKAQREAAYAELSALAADSGAANGPLLAACVGPLVHSVLGVDLDIVDAAEFQRAHIVLAEMFFAHPMEVGVEYMRDDRFSVAWRLSGALNAVYKKEASELTRSDAITVAIDMAILKV